MIGWYRRIISTPLREKWQREQLSDYWLDIRGACPRRVRQKILNLGANSDISCITLTVTENGYCRANSGDLNWQHPEITHDVENPDSPISVPGLLVSLLDARMRADGGPINLISCDNLSANGRVLQSVVSQFAERRSAELAKWIAQNVAFPNTMVDRIVPATSDEDIEVFADTCFTDNALINTEGFTQWVIEDCLVGNAPRWHKQACYSPLMWVRSRQ